jgi:hypothetical protein
VSCPANAGREIERIQPCACHLLAASGSRRGIVLAVTTYCWALFCEQVQPSVTPDHRSRWERQRLTYGDQGAAKSGRQLACVCKRSNSVCTSNLGGLPDGGSYGRAAACLARDQRWASEARTPTKMAAWA